MRRAYDGLRDGREPDSHIQLHARIRIRIKEQLEFHPASELGRCLQKLGRFEEALMGKQKALEGFQASEVENFEKTWYTIMDLVGICDEMGRHVEAWDYMTSLADYGIFTFRQQTRKLVSQRAYLCGTFYWRFENLELAQKFMETALEDSISKASHSVSGRHAYHTYEKTLRNHFWIAICWTKPPTSLFSIFTNGCLL